MSSPTRSRPAVVERVQAAEDPRIADYTRLTDVSLRRLIEPAYGIFIAEGELVIRRALAHGYRLRSMLLHDRYLEALQQLAVDAQVRIYLATPEMLEAITGFNVHRGVLASFERRPLPSVSEVMAGASRLLVLEDMNNPTNVGAVFRCAAGLGMDAVVLSPSCADPLYRRSVRVSMGEVLSLPYARAGEWPGVLDELKAAGFAVVALTPAQHACSLDELTVPEKAALVLGAEGPGLHEQTVAQADFAVRIPMRRGVDSLNVAAAAAVACYVVGRRPFQAACPPKAE